MQDLAYARLRERLLAQGQALDLLPLPPLPPEPQGAGIDPASLPGLVLDDRAAEGREGWSASTNFKPFVGQGYLHDGDAAGGIDLLDVVHALHRQHDFVGIRQRTAHQPRHAALRGDGHAFANTLNSIPAH